MCVCVFAACNVTFAEFWPRRKAVESWEGITHVYMFDLGFTSEQLKGPYPHILKLWLQSSTVQYMITYRKPSFLWKRGFDLTLVTKLRVKQQGNKSGSHLAYFYRKQTAAEAEAATAVAASGREAMEVEAASE